MTKLTSKFAYSFLASVALASSALAGQPVVESKASKDYVAPAPELCFQDREFQLDIFGSYTDGRSNNTHSDEFGGGLAINYFFIRNLGVGVDGNFHEGDVNGVWATSGRLIVRFPIDEICLAPYIFGGGGYEVNGEGFGTLHAGGGIEYRVTPDIGLFGEGRYTWGEDDRNSAQARVGVRFVF